MVFHPWEFTLKDGTTIIAKFTDLEIKLMKEKYPDIKFKED